MEKTPAPIRIMKPGTFTDVKGKTVTFTPADLQQIVDTYDAAEYPAPLVVGHPKTDDPAMGWVKGLGLRDGEIVAEPDQVDPAFAEAVNAGRFRKISASFYSPTSAANPVPGGYYLKHIGFLGAAAPAIKGLGTVAFADGADDDTLTLDFAETDLSRALNAAIDAMKQPRADIVKRMASAAGIAPNTVNEILNGDIASPPDARLRGFSRVLGIAFDTLKSLVPAPAADATPKEINMSETVDLAEHNRVQAELEASRAQLEQLRKEAADREARALHDANVSFAEAQRDAGKLAPFAVERVIALMDNIGAGDVIAFGEGDAREEVSPIDLFKGLFDKAQKIVAFGEHAGAEKGEPEEKSPFDLAQEAVNFAESEKQAGRIVTTAQAVRHVARKANT